MSAERLTLIEACEKSAQIVSRAQEMDELYRRAILAYGEGELRNRILSIAMDAFEDAGLRDDVFVSNENMLSFCCGVWIQFLLIEIAGLKKEKLRALARKVFEDFQTEKRLH